MEAFSSVEYQFTMEDVNMGDNNAMDVKNYPMKDTKNLELDHLIFIINIPHLNHPKLFSPIVHHINSS